MDEDAVSARQIGDVTVDAIRDALEEVDVEINPRDPKSSEILRECAMLCKRMNRSPEKFAESWEAYMLNDSKARLLTRATFDRFEQRFKSKAKVSSLTKQKLGSMAVRNKSSYKTPQKKRGMDSTSTSRAGKRTRSTKVAKLPKVKSTYKDRNFARRSQLQMPIFNEQSAKPGVPYDEGNEPRCTITVYNEQFSKPNSHEAWMEGLGNFDGNRSLMFVPPETRATVLEERLVTLGNLLLEVHDLGPATPVGRPSQSEVVCFGRICCEANGTGEGKLNLKSIMLEGSMEDSSGARVKLLFGRVESCYLFPGQIVAVKGVNMLGSSMIVSEVYSDASPKPCKSSVGTLKAYNYGPSAAEEPGDGIVEKPKSLDGKPLLIISASGPFCVVDDLEYDPLNDLGEEIQRHKPDVLILTGPFVDTQNEQVRTGNVTVKLDEKAVPVTFKQLLQERIALEIDVMLSECPKLQVIIAPSPEDASHLCIFPQEAFSMESFVNKFTKASDPDMYDRFQTRVHLVPNPCTFSINEIYVGLCSADVLMHMRPQVAKKKAKDAPKKHFTEELASQLLQQRSFYPLYPAPRSFALDVTTTKFCAIPRKPDMLILPSKLGNMHGWFAKDVDDVLVINPGRLTKGVSAGTYAKVTVQALRLGDNVQDQDLKEHGVAKRTMVEHILI